MIIEAPTVSLSDNLARIECKYTCKTGDGVLWFTVPGEYQRFLVHERCDAFVVTLLLVAMQAGEDIEVKGVLSEQLYYNLQFHLIALVCLFFPAMRPVSIRADSLDDGHAFVGGKGVALGFSGGIDSFTSLYEHLENPRTPPGFRATHFIFNNVGSHGDSDSSESRALFNQRYELLSEFPREIGKDFIKIDSNVNSCLRLPYPTSHTIRNVPCTLILQKLFGKYLYSASYSYTDFKIHPGVEMTNAEPLVLSLLSTENLACISTGAQYSRITKTALVSQYAPSLRFLNVCLSGSSNNCSVCEKCCRTLFTAELLGTAERYRNIFDLPRFHSVKGRYLASVLAAPDREFNREILELAAQKGYTFSLDIRVRSLWCKLQALLNHAARLYTPQRIRTIVRGLRKDRFGDPSARTHSARSLNDAPSVLNGH